MLTDDSRVVPLTLLAQAGVTVGLALLLKLGLGDVVALSALIGGLIAVIPNGFLAARLLAPRAATSAQALMRAAWLGEVGKLLLTALLFGAAFALIRPISPAAVLGGYIAAQLVVFGALLYGGASGKDNGKSSKNGR
ncbi:MAG TPA: ATP synthase subunit I [Gammaproteobacteria bacterium]